ncbi:4-hydroxy-tetrahydrodipicolinate reductase [Pseudobutyrivibrio xylanivorans]|uniref:4-hydroxy-tetrahydrodipicolinate reductase n=1 Tax=Pseudobutyrivibrio xylanivorans TaxID=185007 RepID=A0A5P6VTV6_PSEXY|nr:4-hydroxy-tetrahydrodipicolinate reductase [Pseudobutyrivibrio xylanivorans]QFJ54644.1 4-hydroxy-tetrahydrodipicolinate reductase [Pseudobutyrivibrio xylanivorans]
MTRVVMHGCNGHMGRVITDICKADSEITIVAGVDKFKGVDNEYPVFDSIDQVDVDYDVVIDFSNAAAVNGLLDSCVKNSKPVVLCTTGLSEEMLAHVDEATKKVAVLRSANMSLGINTLFDLCKKATQIFAEAGFDIEIVEKHHNQKLDAPSGTALALADACNDALNEKYDYCYGRADRREKRPKNEIGISAVRGGNIVGEHEVIFAGLDEVITIKHTAYSKSVFAKGAVEAAKFLAGKPAGLYDMKEVIAEK